MPYSGTPEEVRRKEREKKRRQRALKRLLGEETKHKTEKAEGDTKESPRRASNTDVASKAKEPVIPAMECVLAGEVAGKLEILFRSKGQVALVGEEEIREWLDTHPVGASFVAERLISAGLLGDFRRWRGLR